ncbi:MAG TPA: preprotein translocase subunit YajC [Streptosporangiaceae bacterium]|nr:preprotein translocase subunit YajC [Streptosporangiaceae bacterium]
MGTIYLAASSSGSKGSPVYTFVILAVLVGLFYMLILRPQKARQRKAVNVQSQVMPGQRIRTTAGMYGTVVSGDDRDVVIEISPGVHVTMLRRAVMDVVPEDTGTDLPADDPAPGQTDGTPPDDWDLKDRNI